MLRRIRGGDVEHELSEIRDLATRSDRTRARLRDLRTPWIRRIVVIGVTLGITVQLTGVNSIMYFAPTILQSTGLGTQAALTATIGNGVVSVLAVLIGMKLIDRHGRRRLIITGQTGLVGALLLLGAAFRLPDSSFRSYLVLALMLVFLFFMQSMVATVFWLMMSEIFPLRVRGLATGLAVFAQWLSNAAVTLTFPSLIDALGGVTFFLFAAVNVVTVVFLVRCLPETRNRSLEQIEEHFRTVRGG
ncbi:MFS transporter [Streptomyces himastatinicus]|uniref:MFS transporter n=1 Tax=Streptomyces himastatinicus TaxID=998084 RepID=UPI0001B5035F